MDKFGHRWLKTTEIHAFTSEIFLIFIWLTNALNCLSTNGQSDWWFTIIYYTDFFKSKFFKGKIISSYDWTILAVTRKITPKNNKLSVLQLQFTRGPWPQVAILRSSYNWSFFVYCNKSTLQCCHLKPDIFTYIPTQNLTNFCESYLRLIRLYIRLYKILYKQNILIRFD